MAGWLGWDTAWPCADETAPGDGFASAPGRRLVGVCFTCAIDETTTRLSCPPSPVAPKHVRALGPVLAHPRAGGIHPRPGPLCRVRDLRGPPRYTASAAGGAGRSRVVRPRECRRQGRRRGLGGLDRAAVDDYWPGRRAVHTRIKGDQGRRRRDPSRGISCNGGASNYDAASRINTDQPYSSTKTTCVNDADSNNDAGRWETSPAEQLSDRSSCKTRERQCVPTR